ncbi:hypothetical protein N658DRAFT_62412 [Parathielavia hyrcaniae]|uniref:Uncharacterized protein n=1 Tax=Parathielavia hyrcaniae TaxID=113614 RepID=A0AAN6Q0T4_9PEZI|nr:hypothetical protein N658DRAFT_62412 [Parathielavia hyrcaniae]
MRTWIIAGHLLLMQPDRGKTLSTPFRSADHTHAQETARSGFVFIVISRRLGPGPGQSQNARRPGAISRFVTWVRWRRADGRFGHATTEEQKQGPLPCLCFPLRYLTIHTVHRLDSSLLCSGMYLYHDGIKISVSREGGAGQQPLSGGAARQQDASQWKTGSGDGAFTHEQNSRR